jgi:hypothetical protein
MLFYEAVDLLAPSSQGAEAAIGETAAPVKTGLDMEEIQAGFPSVDQGPGQEMLTGAVEVSSRVSDEEMFDSQLEFDPSSSDVSQDMTPTSSKSSSSGKGPAGECEKLSEMVFPAMKTASDVSNHVGDEHARGASVSVS